MVCTNDSAIYETVRMLRSHGMVRECTSPGAERVVRVAARRFESRFHLRLSRVQRAEHRTQRRHRPLAAWAARREQQAAHAESRSCFWTISIRPSTRPISRLEGSSNYAFTLVLREPNDVLVPERDAARSSSTASNSAAGSPAAATRCGSRILRKVVGANAWKEFPQVDHVHFYGFYLGNYPGLETEQDSAVVRAAQFAAGIAGDGNRRLTIESRKETDHGSVETGCGAHQSPQPHPGLSGAGKRAGGHRETRCGPA